MNLNLGCGPNRASLNVVTVRRRKSWRHVA